MVNTGEPMLNFQYVKTEDKGLVGSKEISLVFNNVRIVYDVEVWEKLYSFFMDSFKGNKMEKVLADNLEYMLASAITNQMRLHIQVCNAPSLAMLTHVV